MSAFNNSKLRQMDFQNIPSVINFSLYVTNLIDFCITVLNFDQSLIIPSEPYFSHTIPYMLWVNVVFIQVTVQRCDATSDLSYTISIQIWLKNYNTQSYSLIYRSTSITSTNIATLMVVIPFRYSSWFFWRNKYHI